MGSGERRDKIRIVYDLLNELRSEKRPSELIGKTFLGFDQVMKYLKSLERNGCVEMREKLIEPRTRSTLSKRRPSKVWIITERGEEKRKLLAAFYESEMFKILPIPRR